MLRTRLVRALTHSLYKAGHITILVLALVVAWRPFIISQDPVVNLSIGQSNLLSCVLMKNFMWRLSNLPYYMPQKGSSKLKLSLLKLLIFLRSRRLVLFVIFW